MSARDSLTLTEQERCEVFAALVMRYFWIVKNEPGARADEKLERLERIIDRLDKLSPEGPPYPANQSERSLLVAWCSRAPKENPDAASNP